ncbi:hypothetical protein IU459_32835 [Nocardia amamiensis]|uniref:Alkaline shock response membrane anchor protein AmaP n=1 Tax=Nocardia amamiensis TaxID=404578 RepID=A0ABS0D0B8_9NOCA|nr:hypothetical protein [Nocardia amamiensis]MBF6302292.1 hypothetical protein [Nocardia amamiensis]
MAPKRSSASRSSRRAAKSSRCKTVFMLVGVPVGLGICTRPMWPADWADRVVEVVVPPAIGVAVVAASVAMLVLALRASSGGGMRRRRWARAVETAGLTRNLLGEQLVPRLISTRREGGEVVLRVRMLTSQTPQDWDRRAQRLARELGAGKARVAWTPDRIEEIELRLTRKQAA